MPTAELSIYTKFGTRPPRAPPISAKYENTRLNLELFADTAQRNAVQVHHLHRVRQQLVAQHRSSENIRRLRVKIAFACIAPLDRQLVDHFLALNRSPLSDTPLLHVLRPQRLAAFRTSPLMHARHTHNAIGVREICASAHVGWVTWLTATFFSFLDQCGVGFHRKLRRRRR